jgi:cell division protein FtsL
MKSTKKTLAKPGQFWGLLIVSSLFLVGMTWQASRFADLSAKAKNLERTQERWVVENRKIEAEIALLSSRERMSSMAGRLGLKKVSPEEVTKIQIDAKHSSPAAGTGKGSGK